jgi:hypothetical protein
VVKDPKICLYFPYLMKAMFTFLISGKLLVWLIRQIIIHSFNETVIACEKSRLFLSLENLVQRNYSCKIIYYCSASL